jgi:hypothetical protein
MPVKGLHMKRNNPCQNSALNTLRDTCGIPATLRFLYLRYANNSQNQLANKNASQYEVASNRLPGVI